jgi:hypothetical protein
MGLRCEERARTAAVAVRQDEQFPRLEGMLLGQRRRAALVRAQVDKVRIVPGRHVHHLASPVTYENDRIALKKENKKMVPRQGQR